VAIKQHGAIVIEKAGLFDTIQDEGRYGFQAQGIPVCGAMDQYAYRMGHLLLGNQAQQASIEMTLRGPELLFTTATFICITGANMLPMLNGKAADMWRIIPVAQGDRLSFSSAQHGMRAYLACQGGFALPQVMGSTSTFVKGALGGVDGRRLRAGDRIAYPSFEGLYAVPPRRSALKGLRLSPDLIPAYDQEVFLLRVVLGSEDHWFTQAAIDCFLSSTYKIRPQSDRMGLRLEGQAINLKKRESLFSSSVPFGGIQVPGDGQPIILMADRQTTGGYPKIATVIEVDLSLAAQARPGQSLHFEAVSVQEAQQLFREQQKICQTLSHLLK
jgi:antagonist of KipI